MTDLRGNHRGTWGLFLGGVSVMQQWDDDELAHRLELLRLDTEQVCLASCEVIRAAAPAPGRSLLWWLDQPPPGRDASGPT